MLRRWSRVIVLVLALLLVLSLSLSQVFAGAVEDELETRRQELERVQREIEEQKQNIVSTRRKEQAVSSELNRLDQRLELTEKELRYLEAQLSVTQKNVQQTDAEVKRAQAELEKRTNFLASRLRALYEIGPAGYLEVILSATDFSDFLTRFDLLQSVITQDVSLLKSIKGEREQYAAKKADLETQQKRLSALQAQNQEKRGEYASRAADRERQLTKLKQQRQEYENALDELEELSEELVQIIQELQAKSQVKFTGKLAFAWPVSGSVTSGFGRRYHPVIRRYRNHTGIDIAAKTGTSVKASEAGVVLHSGWLGGYGKCVILDHGGGYSTLYAHNSTLLVSAGQAVSKGFLIARAGSTGVSTGPHVHFEVRVKGTPQDPRKFVP